MSDTTVPAVKPSFLSNKQYDALKWVALVGLPALGALYFTLAPLWDLPKPHEIVGTVVALDTFLGLLIGVVKKNYTPPTDGALEIDETDTSIIHRLDLKNVTPTDLAKKDVITLEVVKAPPIDK